MRADGQRHGRPLLSKGRTASDYERTVSNSSTRVTTLSFCYLALRTSKCGHTTHPGYLVYVHQLHNGMQNRGELLARSVCQQLPNMVPRQGGLTVLIPRQEGVTTEPIKANYSPTAGTAFVTVDNVRVPVENMLGPEDGGIFVILSNFNHEHWVMICASVRLQRMIMTHLSTGASPPISFFFLSYLLPSLHC